MVLGWGKKTVTKHDDEDMTMEQILASIRRYVTEDQNTTHESYHTKEAQISAPEAASSAPAPASTYQNFEEEQRNHPRLTNYETPYMTNEILRDQSVMSENQLPGARQPDSSVRSEDENEQNNPAKNQGSSQIHPSHSKNSDHSTNFQTSTLPYQHGDNSIAAAAMAFSKLGNIKDEQLGGGGVTIDTLLTNLARPMIKEWLDKNLAEVVELMVAKEIERIRNYPSK